MILLLLIAVFGGVASAAKIEWGPTIRNGNTHSARATLSLDGKLFDWWTVAALHMERFLSSETKVGFSRVFSSESDTSAVLSHGMVATDSMAFFALGAGGDNCVYAFSLATGETQPVRCAPFDATYDAILDLQLLEDGDGKVMICSTFVQMYANATMRCDFVPNFVKNAFHTAAGDAVPLEVCGATTHADVLGVGVYGINARASNFSSSYNVRTWFGKGLCATQVIRDNDNFRAAWRSPADANAWPFAVTALDDDLIVAMSYSSPHPLLRVYNATDGRHRSGEIVIGFAEETINGALTECSGAVGLVYASLSDIPGLYYSGLVLAVCLDIDNAAERSAPSLLRVRVTNSGSSDVQMEAERITLCADTAKYQQEAVGIAALGALAAVVLRGCLVVVDIVNAAVIARLDVNDVFIEDDINLDSFLSPPVLGAALNIVCVTAGRRARNYDTFYEGYIICRHLGTLEPLTEPYPLSILLNSTYAQSMTNDPSNLFYKVYFDEQAVTNLAIASGGLLVSGEYYYLPEIEVNFDNGFYRGNGTAFVAYLKPALLMDISVGVGGATDGTPGGEDDSSKIEETGATSDDGIETWLLLLIVSGAVLVLISVALVVACVVLSRRRRQQRSQQHPSRTRSRAQSTSQQQDSVINDNKSKIASSNDTSSPASRNRAQPLQERSASRSGNLRRTPSNRRVAARTDSGNRSRSRSSSGTVARSRTNSRALANGDYGNATNLLHRADQMQRESRAYNLAPAVYDDAMGASAAAAASPRRGYALAPEVNANYSTLSVEPFSNTLSTTHANRNYTLAPGMSAGDSGDARRNYNFAPAV